MNRIIQLPMNRVEGDLEIRVDLRHGQVHDAWAIGTMYRGIEQMLIGRGPLDGLVITPRVCGICSTSHLLAAARALDAVAQVDVPVNARLVRQMALVSEYLQSDLRHGILMFAADLVNPAYAKRPFFSEAVRRFEPLKGEAVLEVITASRRIPEIISILGGQWPHSAFMVPGGVSSLPSEADLRQCRGLLRQFRTWYEKRILGCAIERWQQITSLDDLDAWLVESNDHDQGDLGALVRICRELGLDQALSGHDRYLAFSDLWVKPEPHGDPFRALQPGGFATPDGRNDLDQRLITEEVGASYYRHSGKGQHPFAAEPHPDPDAGEACYSWCKAPRYAGQPAETGPLAERMVACDSLYLDLVGSQRGSVMARELARLTRPARLLPVMETWLAEINIDRPLYRSPGEISDGEGFGLVQAPRGALGHWLQISEGAIEHYQMVTPTSWNASPRGDDGTRGPMEEALLGLTVADPENPVEIGHVVRSFDPCLVCSVHAVSRGGISLGKVALGMV